MILSGNMSVCHGTPCPVPMVEHSTPDYIGAIERLRVRFTSDDICIAAVYYERYVLVTNIILHD